MICCVCGDPAVINHKYEDFCQFHWDCYRHERKIRLDAVRDFGEGCYIGPQFGVTFHGFLDYDNCHGKFAGVTTLGYCLLVSYSPREAMTEALRIAARNDWKLLRLDVQAGAERRLGMRSCTDIYVSPEFNTYMQYANTAALPYDAEKYGVIEL